MSDPTYVREEIDENPEWKVAFVLSEILNDNAPLGWSKYIGTAKWLLAAFEIKPREEAKHTEKAG